MRFTTARGALLALLAVVVVSVVGAASASAEEAACTKKPGSKVYNLCIEGHWASNNSKVEIVTSLKSTNVVLELNRQVPLTMTCKKLNAPGEFRVGQVGSVSTKLKGYTLDLQECGLNVSYCQVNGAESFREATGSFTTNPAELAVKNEGSGHIFWETEFKNGTEGSCPWLGKKQLTGVYRCKLENPEVNSMEHELVCDTPEHSLEFGLHFFEGPTAFLAYSQMVTLGGPNKGKKFSVYEY
jgi:hypothetical protein